MAEGTQNTEMNEEESRFLAALGMTTFVRDGRREEK